ncbi:hypothetical protein C6I20_04420 [Aeromicrobium sp. A1-2]|uniref:polysaccharide pyruvyl transferase family protein n=1 Tax=Aeromicrobium sp. A1-2 TaxID=2107713 RepID=UPI000E50C292|nr:polysaccharide pyruvyl transferase family protein [Aeromicrobium sp. A1-2]AXT84514.1 hypothetical protein C6I20_04420 [Aeromicrobium sp. A1-2]
MTRILIRAAQDPTVALKAMASAERMGANAGNLLYANAVARTLAARSNRVETGAFDAHLVDRAAWVRKINKRYDHYVVPLANAFRYKNGASLEAMTELVRALDVPVTVVGVGAQATITAASDDARAIRMGKTGGRKLPSAADSAFHDDRVRAFVEAVLEKSTSFGVRGPVTKAYLVGLGLPDERIDVIGCPSVFTWGPEFRVHKGNGPVTEASALSMNIDYRVRGIGAVIERNVALYPRLTSVSQDLKSARMIITGEEQFDMTRRDPRTPVHTAHPLFRGGRLLFFASPWGWIAEMGRMQFVFGNRLHGNIAAILGGTPAHLLAHDSRTLELARYHAIPYSTLDEEATPPTAAELWDRTDYTAFNEAYPGRFGTYIDFLHRNELVTAYDGRNRLPRFDRSIRRGQATPAVVSGHK